MSIKGAFNLILKMHSRPATIQRVNPVIAPASIRISPSNYFRHLEAVGNIMSQGREFVLSKENLDSVSYPLPKRADRIVDADLGTMNITEVREMYDLGGAIIGYRVRVD